MHDPDHIRNIAIIAHIDHGKTTLLDGLLKESNIFRENQDIPERVMDSYDQERERGITIFAKHTCIHYGDYKINIIDSPGHADFSSEVERVLGMVNCVLLIVDAKEGPMPQTRFVLSKALEMGLRPLVVLNKIDRPNSDPERVLDETFDLFVELGATDEQLDFKYCYASALKGYALLELEDPKEGFKPLLDLIVSDTPAPSGDANAPFLMQSTTVYFHDFLGKQACGRVLQGSVKKGDQVKRIDIHGKETKNRITLIEGHLGLAKVELDAASPGDIVTLSGVGEVNIGDTLCDLSITEALPPIYIEAPTVSIDITVNDGPFVGKGGKHVTFNKIKERLYKERKANVSYIIEEKDERTMTVKGRGELHLAVLLEAMRREGYEFCVARPQVIMKEEHGQKMEPLAKTHVVVPEEFAGSVIEQLSTKKGEMQHLHTDEHKLTTLEFLIPVRGLVGYRNEFLNSTKGLGILTSKFTEYGVWKGDIASRRRGVLISMCPGKANGYASFNLQDRGDLFTNPGDEVYEGMIVGQHARDNDLIVNITKPKQLTNVRASGTDEHIVLSPPRQFSLEQAMGFIGNDELVEVTPKALRFRKKLLKEVDRKRAR